MKKIFSTLSLLAIVLLAGTSCSNDEIEINDSQLTFTINLSNVMKYDGIDVIEKHFKSNQTDPVKFLKEVPIEDGFQLRVRNLVYDENGILRKQTEDFASSYNQTIQPRLMVSDGKYTVITLTDIVEKNSKGKVGFHFWDVKDSTILGKTRIVPTGYIGKFESLGFARTEITVGGSTIYEVKPSPVGSMTFLLYRNIKDFKINNKPINYLALQTKHHLDYFYFDSNKSLTILEKNSDDYNWRYAHINPSSSDYTAKNVYNFTFIIGCQNHPISFYARNESGTSIRFTGHSNQDLTCNFKPGVMYAIEVLGKNMMNNSDAEMFVGTAREYDAYLATLASTQKKVRAAQPQFDLFKSANNMFQSDMNFSHRSGYSLNELEKSTAIH